MTGSASRAGRFRQLGFLVRERVGVRGRDCARAGPGGSPRGEVLGTVLDGFGKVLEGFGMSLGGF